MSVRLPDTNRQIVLRRRPEGLVTADDFRTIDAPLPELADGEALMRTVYLGIDPTVRSWLDAGAGYLPAVEIGEVVRCSGAGEIVATRCDAYQVGDVVSSLPGWQEHAIVRDDLFTIKQAPGTDLRAVLGVYGGNGATAYFGLLEVGRPEPGETVVVSGAAGATGSLVGQIARIKECRVVGIAGTDEKCRWVVDELGFDACINYRTDDVATRLKETCPDRVDVYFDNVGGPLLDLVLARLAQRGRVVLCGAIAVYNEEHRPPGPANYLNLIARRGRMEGFITLDYVPRFDESAAQLAEWVADGQLQVREHLVDGLDQAPEALNALFRGDNVGKVIVQVAPELG